MMYGNSAHLSPRHRLLDRLEEQVCVGMPSMSIVGQQCANDSTSCQYGAMFCPCILNLHRMVSRAIKAKIWAILYRASDERLQLSHTLPSTWWPGRHSRRARYRLLRRCARCSACDPRHLATDNGRWGRLFFFLPQIWFISPFAYF